MVKPGQPSRYSVAEKLCFVPVDVNQWINEHTLNAQPERKCNCYARHPWTNKLLITNFFIVTIVAFIILSKILDSAARRAVANFKGASELLKDFVVDVVSKATILIGLIVALSMLEVNVGPFLDAIGAAGFILGFALQGTLSNFAAGLMILLYRPYDVGDFVNVAGTSGTVSNMTLVSTTLTLPDNQSVVQQLNLGRHHY